MTPADVVTGLTDQAILSAWERGRRQPPVERALTLLRDALPAEAAAAPAEWSVGRRDAYLLGVHSATFGERIVAVTACQRCGEQLDLAFRVADIRCPPEGVAERHELSDEPSGHRVVFRLPSSVDLRAAAACDDPDFARRALAERCVLVAERDGEAVPAAMLPQETIDRLAEAMARRDPQADVRFAMACPACEHRWQVQFDVADFLWREVEAKARRLLSDIHTLARAYGWREPDILALSDERRQTYLELLTA
jgi:hypothetical protein